MKQGLRGLAWAAVMLTAIFLAQSLLQVSDSGAQQSPGLGVDADPTGNTATSLGTIQSCVSVSSGQTFQVDVFIAGVTDLLGWEAYFVYDPAIVKVSERNVRMFQAANPGSQVLDTSDSPPDQGGHYRVSAVDIAEPPALDSGPGVLARLTLVAVSAGVSPASLPLIDMTGDTKPDFGPTLTDASGKSIGDANGDGLFDSPVADAWIAVDTACPQQPPPLPTLAPFASVTSTPRPRPTATAAPPTTLTLTPPAMGTPSAGDDGPPWGVIGLLSGGAAVLGAAALLLWQLWARRRA
jgi:hypothetical protein